jgi:hypothetical protein
VLRWRGESQAFAGTGMAGEKSRTWLLYRLGVILFCAVETLLNYVSKLGQLGNPAALYPSGSTTNIQPMGLNQVGKEAG